MSLDVGDHLGRDIQEVRGDPQHAVAGRASRAPFASPTVGVRRGFHQEHPHAVVGPSLMLGDTEIHDHVAEDVGGRSRRRDRTLLGHRVEVAIVADPADVTALRGDDVIPEGELGVPTVHDVAVVGL